VALLGGAGVELDANSVLSWDAERRPLVERGLARFEVPHQAPGARFAVSAGPYVITVVGTKFHVGVDDDRVSVEVEQGVVEVWRGSRSVRLAEGDSWAGPIRGLASPGVERRVSLAGASPRRGVSCGQFAAGGKRSGERRIGGGADGRWAKVGRRTR